MLLCHKIGFSLLEPLYKVNSFLSSPGQSPERAIILPPAFALALAAAALAKSSSFYIKVFYVMGKVLSGELFCPCDRSCFDI